MSGERIKDNKILVVDGDASILDAVTSTLRDAGYKVQTSQTGAGALKLVEKETPDLVLLAIKLPDIDGFEMCRQFRILEATGQVPIVFLSSQTETSDIVQAFSSGGSDYMVKPFREKELLSRIKTHLTRSQIQKQLNQKNVELKNEIVERVRVEEKLRESENLLRTIIESLPFDFFVIGRDGRYIMQNATLRKHGGDVIGKFPSEVALNEEDLAVWESNNRRAFDGEVVKGEEVIHLKEGDKYIYNIVSPIRDGDAITGIMGINIDITERRWVEEILKETKEAKGKLTRLINDCPHPVMRLSLDGIILFANPAADGILEFWGCRVGEQSPQPFLSHIQGAFQSSDPSSCELTLKDGTTVSITLIPEAEKKTLSAYGIIHKPSMTPLN